MGNLANKFLEAVNIISDAKTKSAGFDRSVQVTIKKLYQEDSTKYEVEYEGALKTATGAIGYKTNDVVWAVIPKNDLTQTLQIIGLVSSIAADKQVLRSEDDKFEKVTPNLATFETEWNLPYEDEDKEIQFIKTIWSATGSDNDNLITLQASKVIDAIQSSLYFEIGVIFESSINLNTDTNFGIRCYCNGVTDKPKFVLDINDIIGNPYNLIGEQQKKVFEITDKTDLTSFDKIDFFAESLGEKDKITLTSFSFYGCRDVDYMTGLAANLLVSETGTDFCELGGLSTNNYNLDTTVINNLIFKANLRYDGVLVTENELSKYTYKWYLRTLENGLPIEIAIGDNPNTKDIVETWYFNKEESDNRIIPDDWFSTIKDAPNQLKVSAAALFMPSSWIWCEVIDEKGNKVKTVEGWINNVNKSYDLQLIAPTPEPDEETGKFSSTLTIKQIAKDENGEEIDPPPGLVYKWFKDGVEMVDEEQEDKPPIRTSSITIFAEDHEYKCEVYTTNNFLVFMEIHKSVFIPDVPTMEQDSVIITGQTVYLCKANGEFIGQMSPLKAWFYQQGELIVEDALKGYSFQWDIPDDEITMLKAVTPLNQQETTFSAKQYLLNEYTNNTVSVSVSDSSGKTIASTSVEITFLKNGQPGTNGTDIVCTFEKTINSQTQSIGYYQIQQGSSIPANTLSIKVFRPSTGVNLTPTSISVIDMKTQKALDLTTDNIEISGPTCLKATCILKDTAGIVIATWYAYLPIVVCSSDPSDSGSFRLDSASPYVQFSSGGNIAEDMPKTFTYTQGNDAVTATIDSKYLNVIKKDNAYNAIILQVKEDNAVFRGDEILSTVTLTHPTKGTIQIPILLLTNRFEYAAINGWDGTGIKLDEENNTVLAPMAGFGKKEEDNSFTGVVLGNITSDSNEDTFQGLIGMYQSERTFSLNANDGSAWFKGHIEATSGKIGEVAIDAVMPTNTSGSYSWKFSPTDGLFMWKGAQGTISSDDPTGGALFSITENGLHMKGSGTFEGEINATGGGNIGGFTIDPTDQTLISGNVGISANPSNWAFWAGDSNPENAPFRVGHDGSIVADRLEISAGQIKDQLTASKINADGLKVTNGDFSGTLSAAIGNFGGNLTANTTQFKKIQVSGAANEISFGSGGMVMYDGSDLAFSLIIGASNSNTRNHIMYARNGFMTSYNGSGEAAGKTVTLYLKGLEWSEDATNYSSKLKLEITGGIITNYSTY